MSSSVLDERIQALVGPIKEELEQLRAQIRAEEDAFKEREREHRSKLRAMEADELRIIDGLAAFGVKVQARRFKTSANASNGTKTSTPSGRTRKSPGGVATGMGISLETALVYAEKIKEIIAAREKADEEAVFTQRELHEMMRDDTGPKDKAGLAIKYLHSIEFLRRAGFDTRGELWAIMDADALDRVVDRVVNNDQYERERFINADPDSDNEYERVAAYVRDHSPVHGVVDAQTAAQARESVIDHIMVRLEELDLIKRHRQRGARTKIEWTAKKPTKRRSRKETADA